MHKNGVLKTLVTSVHTYLVCVCAIYVAPEYYCKEKIKFKSNQKICSMNVFLKKIGQPCKMIAFVYYRLTVI